MAAKKLLTVWAKYLMRLKDLIEFFQKIVWLIGFGVTVREILRAEYQKTAESTNKTNEILQ